MDAGLALRVQFPHAELAPDAWEAHSVAPRRVFVPVSQAPRFSEFSPPYTGRSLNGQGFVMSPTVRFPSITDSESSCRLVLGLLLPRPNRTLLSGVLSYSEMVSVVREIPMTERLK